MSSSQPFIEHFYELRRRLGLVAFALIGGSLAGYFLRDHLLELLVKPLNQPLYFTTPGGGFDFVVKLCLVFGFILATPVAIRQLFLFLRPIMSEQSNKFIRVASFASVLLMAGGVVFGYFVTLPGALHFLQEFSSDSVRSLITTDEYFSFVMIYLAGFGLLFQLPLIVLFINRIKPLKPSKMLKAERWLILLSFIAAAIITPTPDPLNQLMMAAPIIILYNLSLIMITLLNRRKTEPVAPTMQPTLQPTRQFAIELAGQQTTSSPRRPAMRSVRTTDGFAIRPRSMPLTQAASTRPMPTTQMPIRSHTAPRQHLSFDIL